MNLVFVLIVALVQAARSAVNPSSDGVKVDFKPKFNTCLTKGYQIVDMKTTVSWISALVFCKERRMDLATIRSSDETNLFDQTISELKKQRDGPKLDFKAIWVGGTDLHSTRGYFWVSDGGPLIYSNWSPGEPLNAGGLEHCLSVLTSGLQWNNLDCAGIADRTTLVACEYSRSC